ncbi:MAG: rhodanese-like domain-containing protein [Candidatus Doudnabacteria bacterium]|nr:rhodanese-like domain-containing protein [Candidatus Doudnabacteria bacterium]
MTQKYIFFGVAGVAIILSVFLFWKGGPNNENSSAVKGASIVAETYMDVRTDQEWAAGHLDGAVHFDLVKMQQGLLPDLPKNTPIALYCRSGHRAGEALAILQQNGFTAVRNAGAFSDLQSQGKKICIGDLASCN